MKKLFKFCVFLIIFYLVCFIVSLFVVNDNNTYTRVLMHELHQQKEIDLMFCGASHVSHGILPSQLDKTLNINSFNTGTPNQSMDGTYAVLKETLSFCKLKNVYLEFDFATAATSAFSKSKPSTSNFLVQHYLKNKKVKAEYILGSTSPKYYLNSILPIGQDKLIDLNPVSIFTMIKSRATGEYGKYIFEEETTKYGGKGCVLDEDIVENGTFSSGLVSPIDVKNINQEWKDTIGKIVKLCKENGINLAFYSNPSTDFYLTEKGNYDEYIDFLRSVTNHYGLPYYDFSLVKPEYFELEDSDFMDDNHLNKYGIPKFTSFFADFYSGKFDGKDIFYDSFKEKLLAQNPKVYGLMLEDDIEGHCVKITPVMNRDNNSSVSYDIYTIIGGKENLYIKGLTGSDFNYPENTTGKLKIVAYYNGNQHCCVKQSYSAL